MLSGELPNPASPPTGCGFRTRCPVAIDRCAGTWPALNVVGPRHYVSCVHHSDVAEGMTLVQ